MTDDAKAFDDALRDQLRRRVQRTTVTRIQPPDPANARMNRLIRRQPEEEPPKVA